MITTQKNERMFILDTKIVESSNPERPADSRPAWTQKGSGEAALVAPQNMKMLWTAAAGLNIFDPKDSAAIAKFDWDAFEASALSDSQPLNGCRLHISARTQEKKKKKGEFFTKMEFTPSKNLTPFQLKLQKTAREAK